MKRLVILGGTGFVGRNLARHLRPNFDKVQISNSRLVDISDKNLMMASGITEDSIVINAAGVKDVERLEKSPTVAYRYNAVGAGNVAWYCQHIGAKLIHISSDHAYATPATVYGKSKRLGDELVRRECPNAIIAVTGHVYDVDCPWVKWLDGELRAGRTVEAWKDIDNRPTYAGDLARIILEATEDNLWGKTLLATTEGWTSRLELFRDYCNVFGYDSELIQLAKDEAPWYYPRHFYIPSIGAIRTNTGLHSMLGGFLSMKREMAHA